MPPMWKLWTFVWQRQLMPWFILFRCFLLGKCSWNCSRACSIQVRVQWQQPFLQESRDFYTFLHFCSCFPPPFAPAISTDSMQVLYFFFPLKNKKKWKNKLSWCFHCLFFFCSACKRDRWYWSWLFVCVEEFIKHNADCMTNIECGILFAAGYGAG